MPAETSKTPVTVYVAYNADEYVWTAKATDQPGDRTLMNFGSATELYTEYPDFLASVLGVEKSSLALSWESDGAVVSKLLKEAISTLQLAHDIAAMRESGQHLADYSLARLAVERYRKDIEGAA